MNKQRVNNYLPAAIKALGDCGIADKTTGVIIKTYRSNISGFGAAVAMGSFKAAVAFYSSDAKSNTGEAGKINRSKLIQAMDLIVNSDKENYEKKEAQEICKEILTNRTDKSVLDALCEKYLDASIALKLAMNSFDLKDQDSKAKEKQGE